MFRVIKKTMQILQPPSWVLPRGYSNGIRTSGDLVFVGGQIGWDGQQQFNSEDFVEQAHQALLNTCAVLEQAGATPAHITRMTWFITSREEYIASLKELGKVYREVIGDHYPVMSMLEVSALMEEKAKVEIESTAVIPS